METVRLWKGFGWGVLATVVMSIIMITGKVTGIAPMPAPIPVAIVKTMIGEAPKPLIVILGFIAHLSYGGIFGALLAGLTKKVTVKKGIWLGIILWLVMQITVLPFLGWGIFGSAITPKIAVATLILHLVYGSVFGLLVDKKRVKS
jgi:hypothetical protein